MAFQLLFLLSVHCIFTASSAFTGRPFPASTQPVPLQRRGSTVDGDSPTPLQTIFSTWTEGTGTGTYLAQECAVGYTRATSRTYFGCCIIGGPCLFETSSPYFCGYMYSTSDMSTPCCNSQEPKCPSSYSYCGPNAYALGSYILLQTPGDTHAGYTAFYCGGTTNTRDTVYRTLTDVISSCTATQVYKGTTSFYPCVVVSAQTSTLANPMGSSSTTSTPSVSTSSSSSQIPTRSESNSQNKIAIGIGVGIGVPTVIIGFLSWWFPRHRKGVTP
ncbi:hypothetical protein F5882DRAFT_518981 [Hyaloscypha sp. PMI_1271]|nr:hypothetical protein F5882DRAFT_518981 [Hyaloscypha sp. PMI_1271]